MGGEFEIVSEFNLIWSSSGFGLHLVNLNFVVNGY